MDDDFKNSTEQKIQSDTIADPFYSPENIAELERRIESIKNGTSIPKEHKLIEVDD
jgi:hypothetical protein